MLFCRLLLTKSNPFSLYINRGIFTDGGYSKALTEYLEVTTISAKPVRQRFSLEKNPGRGLTRREIAVIIVLIK